MSSNFISRFHCIAFIFLVFFGGTGYGQILHVEPPDWWIGMKNTKLQLLVHGDDIGETAPTINYPGVSITKINRGQSKNYLFIDFEIKSTAAPGEMKINFVKNGHLVYSYGYQLKTREKNAANVTGFNSEDVIYLIAPDRFANGDTTNDVVPAMKETICNRKKEGARHGGDIRGIINHLDYIAAMGFTTIWPMPVLENDMESYSYHGYAITNHYKVDPRFGTLDNYIELATKARQKGLKLIFDEVVNHTGTNYWWMYDLPFADWLNFADSIQLTNHRRTVNQDPYASEYDRRLMLQGWFVTTMADMNVTNPFMAQYLIQSSIWWAETLHHNGIRLDTYCYSDKNFLRQWTCAIMSEYPHMNIVGEEWSLNPLITSYWQQGKVNKDGYSDCLPSIMDFPLQNVLVSALLDTAGSEYGRGITKLYEALSNDYVYANPENILVMGDNHDMDRLFTQLNNDIALTKMALTYLLTIRGIPQLLYGTEILMDNSQHKNDHGYIRSDFPGGWHGDSVNAKTGLGLTPEKIEMQEWLRRLLNWRKKNECIAHGKTLHFAPFDNIYVYFRYNDTSTTMIVLNKNKKVVKLDNTRFAELISTKTSAHNIMTGEEIDLIKGISLAPVSASIFELH